MIVNKTGSLCPHGNYSEGKGLCSWNVPWSGEENSSGRLGLERP